MITRIGPGKVAEAVGVETNNVYQWRRKDSIPAAYWKDLSERGLVTLQELADAAASRRA